MNGAIARAWRLRRGAMSGRVVNTVAGHDRPRMLQADQRGSPEREGTTIVRAKMPLGLITDKVCWVLCGSLGGPGT